jgi:hypothetical protein
MPKTGNLVIGIMMAVMGLLFLAYLPKASAHFAREQQAGKMSAEEAGKNRKIVKLAGIGSLVVGFGLILIHLFKLYD